MQTFYRAVCAVVIASLMMLPFGANAAMIATKDSVASAAGSTVESLNSIVREHVATELQLMGASPAAAQERVAALTDDEVMRIATHVATAPAAGGSYEVGVAVILLIAAYIIDSKWGPGGSQR
jgi:Family of unknown function (DUF6627)